MIPLGRVISQSEWLRVIAEALRMLPAELAERTDLLALDAALEAPAAHHRGVPIHTSLAAQAGAQTHAMLVRPPFPPARRALAFLTLELFVGHSGAQLHVTEAQRDAFLGEAENAQPTRERLTSWIAERLEEDVEDSTPPTGTPSAPMPVVYIGVPVCGVCGDDKACERLRILAEGAQTAVREFAQARGWPDVRIEFAALPYVGGEHDKDDSETDEFEQALQRFAQASPDERLRRTMLNALRAADALILVGAERRSFGNGYESGRMSTTAGQLVLAARGHALSRWLANEPGFAFLQLQLQAWTEATVRQAVHEWLQTRGALIVEHHWRRRQSRLLIFGPTAAKFAETWGALPTGRARLEAYAETGLPVDRFTELLSPDGVATASFEELRAMCAALKLPLDTVTDGASAPAFVLNHAQRQWLVRFADQNALTREMERSLETEAERQMALGVLRYTLTSLEDWLAFAREVARGHLG